MTNLRTAFAALVVALLTLGWGGAALAATLHASEGGAAQWAEKVDGASAGPIRALALIVLLAAVALALIPEREAAE